MNYRIIRINTVKAEYEGELSFFESNNDIPFEIKRIYYIYGALTGTERGKHAHKKLKQLLFCPYGSITIKLDDGYTQEQVTLNRPNKGLCLEPGLWREMLWNMDNSVLCVAASDYYKETDYIRDYEEYLEYLRRERN
nr:FdtA/QdtA family cupin domain-containing protein [uncultured Eisenbergiella sp.]